MLDGPNAEVHAEPSNKNTAMLVVVVGIRRCILKAILSVTVAQIAGHGWMGILSATTYVLQISLRTTINVNVVVPWPEKMSVRT